MNEEEKEKMQKKQCYLLYHCFQKVVVSWTSHNDTTDHLLCHTKNVFDCRFKQGVKVM